LSTEARKKEEKEEYCGEYAHERLARERGKGGDKCRKAICCKFQSKKLASQHCLAIHPGDQGASSIKQGSANGSTVCDNSIIKATCYGEGGAFGLVKNIRK